MHPTTTVSTTITTIDIVLFCSGYCDKFRPISCEIPRAVFAYCVLEIVVMSAGLGGLVVFQSVEEQYSSEKGGRGWGEGGGRG